MDKNKKAFILIKQMIDDLDEKVSLNQAKIESLLNRNSNEKIISLISKIDKLENRISELEGKFLHKQNKINKNLKININ